MSFVLFQRIRWLFIASCGDFRFTHVVNFLRQEMRGKRESKIEMVFTKLNDYLHRYACFYAVLIERRDHHEISNSQWNMEEQVILLSRLECGVNIIMGVMLWPDVCHYCTFTIWAHFFLWTVSSELISLSRWITSVISTMFILCQIIQLLKFILHYTSF